MPVRPMDLTSGEYATVLKEHLLPKLTAAALLRLSSTCRAWKAAVDGVPGSVWRAAAAAELPQPCVSCTNSAEALALLKRYEDAKRRIYKQLKSVSDFGLDMKVMQYEHPKQTLQGGNYKLCSIPQFAPDGSALAYTCTHGDSDEILSVYDLHTGLFAKVRLRAGLDYSPEMGPLKWLADAQHIKYAQWSENDQHIECITFQRSENVLRRDHAICMKPDIALAPALSLSPCGGLLLASGRAKGCTPDGPAPSRFEIWDCSCNARLLQALEGPFGQFIWSSDGARLAIVCKGSQDESGSLQLVHVETGTITCLPQWGDFTPQQWCGDSISLLIDEVQGGGLVIDPTGRVKVPQHTRVTISPCGTKALCGHAEEYMHQYGAEAQRFSWAVRSLQAGSSSEEVCELEEDGVSSTKDFCWSPDGLFVVSTDYTWDVDEYSSEVGVDDHGVSIYDCKTGQGIGGFTADTLHPHSFVWAPDGCAVAYMHHHHDEAADTFWCRVNLIRFDQQL